MIQRKQNYLLLAYFIIILLGTTAVVNAASQNSKMSPETAVSHLTNTTPQSALTCPSPLKVMPVGDSITYGIGSTGLGTDGTGGGYRKPLLDSLTGAGYNIDYVGSIEDPNIPGFDNHHEGYPGDATDAFINRIYFRLRANPADVVLIHLGTNDITNGDTDPTTDLGPMLDRIDDHENDESTHVTVILAQIINRPCDLSNPVGNCDIKVTQTSELNDNIATLVQARVAAGDDIRLVNMEDNTGLDYSAGSPDFADDKHPTNTGYAKVAAVWFSELESYFTDTCTDSPPSITSIPGAEVLAGQPYTYDVAATGTDPITFSLTTSPSGMNIVSSTGLITWTPGSNQLGINNVTVSAGNLLGTDTQAFTVTVNAKPTFTSSPGTTAASGIQYTYQAAVTAYPAATYSLPAAPTGMVIDSNSGILTWTPGTDDIGQTIPVSIQASNNQGSTLQSFNIQVQEMESIFLPLIMNQ